MEPSVDKVEIFGQETEVFIWGSSKSPNLFLLHGFMERGVTFQPLMSDLGERFHCMAPDLRGFGPRNWTANERGYFYEEYIKDLHALLEHYQPGDSCHILGFSLGGNIGSIYAGAFPERIRSFVNLEGIGLPDFPYEEGPKRVREWVFQKETQSKRTYDSREAYEDFLLRKFKQLNKEDAAILAQHYLIPSGGKLSRCYDPKHRWPNPRVFHLGERQAFWKSIEAPMILMLGRETRLEDYWPEGTETEDVIKQRVNSFPTHMQVKWIEGASHQMHWDQPRQVAEAIMAFHDSIDT